MRGSFWLTALVCAGGLLAGTAYVRAQEKKPAEEPKKAEPKKDAPKADKPATDKPMSPEMEAMMKKWEEAATPGPAHKVLDPLVGKWDYAVRWWMAPDAPAEESKGSGETKWIMDKHYLQQDVQSPPMQPDMPAFRGMGLFGYDNLKKQYFSIWIDNMCTGPMILWGTADAAGKVITFTGEEPDLMKGGTKKVRNVMRFESPDRIVSEQFAPGPDGKEMREMEIIYTRAK